MVVDSCLFQQMPSKRATGIWISSATQVLLLGGADDDEATASQSKSRIQLWRRTLNVKLND